MPYNEAQTSWIRRPPWLEVALGVSILSLIAQLAWPAICDWRQRPRPGVIALRSAELLARHHETRNLLPHLLYLPPEYSSKDSWPLLLSLHGSGERGTDISQVLQGGGPPTYLAQIDHLPFVVVAPQCPPNQSWSSERLLALLDEIERRYPINGVFVTGYSMGGYGTWRLAQAAPERFRAVVPVCGGGDPEQAQQLRNLPIWAFHGEEDGVVPLQSSEDMVNAVRAAGGTAKLTIYPQRGHDICSLTYQNPELYAWMLSYVAER